MVEIKQALLSQSNDTGYANETTVDGDVETAEFLGFLKARRMAEIADTSRITTNDKTVYSKRPGRP